MSGTPTGRKRGGQPGNNNHLKHGQNAMLISVQDDAALQRMSLDQDENELALACVRLKTCLEQQSRANPEAWLAYERAVAQYINLIAALIHKNAVLHHDDKTAFMTVLEMINQVNKEQGVQ